MPLSPQRKKEYFTRMTQFLGTYTKAFVVAIDNVGSNQMQQIRLAMRGKAEVLMGKNTLMRKVLSLFVQNNPGHPAAAIADLLVGNVGLVFTNGDLRKVRDGLLANRVPAPARVGALSPVDVVVPAGPTGCDPGQTSFFQALQVATKINKGQIEIVSDVRLLKAGDRVGNSEATLLQKLNIRPFSYGLVVTHIYDNGSVFEPDVLDLTEEHLTSRFLEAVRRVAAVSLQIGYPTQASIPHSIANAFKAVLAITVQLDNYTFPKADPFKAYLADPSAFAVAAPAAAAAAAPAAAAKEEKKEEEEEVDLGGGLDMFGTSSGGGGKDY